MQEGVSDETAATKARSAGITVIMNMCMMKMHKNVKS
jgi:predicted CoA-binding protein